MRTVGIDFASQPRSTALREIDWDGSPAKVVQVATHVSDDDIRDVVLHGQERVLGVDIPFGWPIHFVQFVTAHLNGDALPRGVSSTQRRLRATDEFIWEMCRRQPLSVSTDRIGIPAMRWAVLMQEFAVTNRAGDGFVYEVYAAAARLNWGSRSRITSRHWTSSWLSARSPSSLPISMPSFCRVSTPSMPLSARCPRVPPFST